MVNFNIIFWSLWVELNLPFNMVFLMIDSNQECAACEKSLGSTEYSVFGGNVTCCVMCIFSSSCAVLLNCSTSHTADVVKFCQSVYSCIIYQKLFFLLTKKCYFDISLQIALRGLCEDLNIPFQPTMLK